MHVHVPFRKRLWFPALMSAMRTRVRTHTHTHTRIHIHMHIYTYSPDVLTQKVDLHLVSCMDLPVADTLSEPRILKQECQRWRIT